MEVRNMDVKFWKALLAYTGSLCIGYKEIKNALHETYLSDLAIEYSPNFTKPKELDMKEIEPTLNKFYRSRFPWLNQNNSG